MINKKFKAREGSPFPVKDAQKIGEELDKIKSEKGILNPKLIVEDAKNQLSVLHNYFEWDNDKAGEKWRLQQARMIVNHIVEISVINGEEVEERAFFSVVGINDENIYVSQSEAISNPTYKKQLIEEMKTILENLLNLMKLFSNI